MGAYTFQAIQTRVSDEIDDSSNGSVSLTQVKQAIVSAVEHYERERAWFNEMVTSALATVASFPGIAVPSDLVSIDKVQLSTTTTITGTTTSGNATIASLSSVSDLAVGKVITGAGIPAQTFVATVGASSLTMCDIFGAAVNATASASITITVYASAKIPLDEISYDQWANQSYGATGASQPVQYAYYQDRLLLYPYPNAVYGIILSYVKRLTTLSANSDNNGWTNYCEPLIRSRAKWDIFKNLLYFSKLADDAKKEELDALAMLDSERYQKEMAGKTRAVYL